MIILTVLGGVVVVSAVAGWFSNHLRIEKLENDLTELKLKLHK